MAGHTNRLSLPAHFHADHHESNPFMLFSCNKPSRWLSTPPPSSVRPPARGYGYGTGSGCCPSWFLPVSPAQSSLSLPHLPSTMSQSVRPSVRWSIQVALLPPFFPSLPHHTLYPSCSSSPTAHRRRTELEGWVTLLWGHTYLTSGLRGGRLALFAQ